MLSTIAFFHPVFAFKLKSYFQRAQWPSEATPMTLQTQTSTENLIGKPKFTFFNFLKNENS